eukprot:5294243-Amphidinium_carterae.1
MYMSNIYWSLDLFVHFLLPIDVDGDLVTDLRSIAATYLRTSFVQSLAADLPSPKLWSKSSNLQICRSNAVLERSTVQLRVQISAGVVGEAGAKGHG